MNRYITQSMYGLLILILTVLGVFLFLFEESNAMHQLATKTVPQTAQAATNGGEEVPANCRYGAVYGSNDDFQFFDDLNIGWTLNFRARYSSALPSYVDFAHVIRLKQERDNEGNRLNEYILVNDPLHDDPGGLGELVASNKGKLWLIGNEVDRVFVQDDMEPAIYATAYHDVYHFIKQRDPSAQIAISGLVEVTPGRLQYLDLVWQAYIDQYQTTIPVDVWNMHIYVLPEIQANGEPSLAHIAINTDPSLAILQSDLTPNQCHRADVYCYAEHDDINIFIEQVLLMREWMKAKGEQDKPLILSEYSTLFVVYYEGGAPFFDENGEQFLPERVISFMEETFNYMENAADPNLGYPEDDYRLVQQWMWFAMNEGYEGSSNKLVDINRTGFTPIGEAFRDYTNSIPFTNNLYPKASYPLLASQETLTATLTVQVGNNGNSQTMMPIEVAFYSDEARTQEIGRATIPAGLGGCTLESAVASVDWALSEPGFYPYWYTVDDGNVANETNETDNHGMGYVLIGGENTYLPLIRR